MARKFTFRVSVTKYNRSQIKQEIIQATESSKELRAEIARVFQQANRRIQNVEKSGVYSPAVESLGDRGTRFSKFAMGGKSWTVLKMEYGRAIAFLNQPTSTSTGARAYNEQIKHRYNLTDTEFNALASEYMGKTSSLSGTAFVEKYLKRYKDFSGEFESAVASSAQQMESEAHQLADGLQQSINEAAEDIARVVDEFNDGLDMPF